MRRPNMLRMAALLDQRSSCMKMETRHWQKPMPGFHVPRGTGDRIAFWACRRPSGCRCWGSFLRRSPAVHLLDDTEVAVEGDVAGHDALLGVLAHDEVAAGAAEAGAQVGVREQVRQGLGEGGNVFRRHEQAVDAGAYHHATALD